MRSAPLRVLGAHPRDRQPIELHAGRYGPYVKHGTTNATLPDRDAVDSLSLEQAIALIDEKAGREPARGTRRPTATRAPRKPKAAASPPAALEGKRRIAPARGARADAVVPRAPARTARSTKRTPAAKETASTGAGKSAATSPRAAAVKKRAGATKRKGTATVRASSAKSTPARKPAASGTARKAKRR
jgi:DNA topoisomerase-like protein